MLNSRIELTFAGQDGPYERPDKNQITATFELPGISKDKVHIDVQNGNLAVSGETTQLFEQREQGYAIKERKSGRFVRTIGSSEGTKVSSEFPFIPEFFRWGFASEEFFCTFAVQGYQGVDGEWHLDRHLSQVFP